MLVQAGRYAKAIVEDGLSVGAYGVPFLYGTNGSVIWFHDARHDLNVSREFAPFIRPRRSWSFSVVASVPARRERRD